MVKKVTVSRYVDRFGTLHDTFAEAERAEAYRAVNRCKRNPCCGDQAFCTGISALREAIDSQQSDSPVAQRREQLAEEIAETEREHWATWWMGKD